MPSVISEDFLEMVTESLDDAIETPNAVWCSVNDNVAIDADKPFDVIQAETSETPVKILFDIEGNQNRESVKYRIDTETVNGRLLGYMYPTTFEPNLKDYVKHEGRTLSIIAIDPIQPVDIVILYIIRFGA